VFIPPAPPAQASNDPLDAAPHVQVHANRCCADADAGPQLVQQQLPMPPPPPPRRQLRQSSNRSTWSSPSFGGLPDFSSFADDDEVAPVPTAPGAQSQPQPEPELAESGALMISTKVEYTAIPGGESQDVFGIVTLQAAEQPELQAGSTDVRQPLDIICVLDVSGSMGGQKLRLVQDAVRFVVNECQTQDRLSIVTFSSGAARVLRLCRMSADGKNEATVSTLQLSAGGGTNIASGLETALEVAERRRYRNPVSAILLLTDGQDGSSRHSLPGLVQRAQRAGCSLYAFGFGSDHDARLLAEVAELAQTPFTFVEDVDQIKPAFAGAVGGLSSVAAQQVEVTLQCSAGLKNVHTPFPTSRDGQNAVVKIPDMLAGERRDILVEMTVPVASGSDDSLLLSATAKYFDLAAGTNVQSPVAEMRLHRTASDEPQPEMEPDEEVTTQRNRVEVAQTLQEAAVHGEAGRFEQARSVLEVQEKRMRGKKGKSAISEALQIELEEARERMTSRSSWEDGGMAEMRDAMQMHKMQRSTNMNVSSKSHSSKKACKAMYFTSVQESWVSKSRG